MLMSRRPSAPGEHGAVAVTAAVLAVVLIGMAALVVDLGQAFVERRDLQAHADFAALAAGADLPGIAGSKDPDLEAVKTAAQYLTVNGFDNVAAVTPGVLVDGDELNGEVYFETDTTFRVMAPVSRVHFGLAAVLGRSYVDINAEATVRIDSPGRPLPFFLPRDCTQGPVELKDNANNNNVITFNPASSNGNAMPKIDSVGELGLPGTPSPLSVYGQKFTADMVADFHRESTGDRVPADPEAGIPIDQLAVDTSGPQESDEAVVTLPPGVYNRPGAWLVRLSNSHGYSRTFGRFVVGSPVAPQEGCGVAATGDFGMLDSPRLGVNQLADATALNIAEGLDHYPVVFTGTLPDDTVQDPCNGNGGTPPPGAQNDVVSRPGNNCVGIKTGMNTDTVTNGLIIGGTVNGEDFDGLLDTETLSGCDRNGGSSERLVLGKHINDDVLSCFLKPGVTVGQVTGSTVPAAAKNAIGSRIFESPRFATVPVINFAVNPQNGYYPILRWQPVFITDEALPSKNQESYATSANGVLVSNSASKVVGLTVIPIHPDALPLVADSSGPSIPYTGTGPKIVRMIN